MAHECPDCTFAADKGWLFVYLISREMKSRASSEPVFCGKFTMTDWSGHSSFYLFRCSSCSELCVDYPHGYRGEGFVYIRCDHCRREVVLKPKQFKEVYERDDLHIPREPTRKERRELARLMRQRLTEIEEIREKGVIPIGVPFVKTSEPGTEKTLKQRFLSLFGIQS